jgi:hypothetical protein
MRERLALAQPLGEPDRPLPPLLGGRPVGAQRPELRAVRVRHRQLAAGRERFELRDRIDGVAVGFLVAALEPVQAGEPAPRVALAEGISELAARGERLFASGDRLVHLIGQVALVRAALEQLRPLGGGQLGGPAQRAGVLLGRLAVGAETRGPLGGGDRVAQHRGALAGGFGVVGEPRRVGAARLEPLEHGAVQRGPPARRDLGLDGQPRQLVPERHRLAVHAGHPGQDALVERLVGGVDQLGIGRPGHDGEPRQQLTGGIAQHRGAGEHRVAHRRGDRRRGRGEHLGDVERVAAGARVQVVAVDAVRLGQLADGLDAERREPDARDIGRGRQLAEHDAQRVVGDVAERRDHERRHAAHPAAEQPQDVERAAVGPVHVLDDEDGAGPVAQLLQQGGGHRRGARAVGDDLLQHAPGRVGDVEQRSERARRLQRVAGAPQRAPVLRELAHERGLADARLAADQHEPPGRAGEHVEEGLALEEHETDPHDSRRAPQGGAPRMIRRRRGASEPRRGSAASSATGSRSGGCARA